MSSSPVRLRQRSVPSGAATPLSSRSRSDPGAPPARIAVTYQSITAIRPFERVLRRRGKGQIDRLARNIARFGAIVPVLVTDVNEIIDGHAIYEACLQLGCETIPTIAVKHLSSDEIRALRLSLNKISEESRWDLQALAGEFAHLLAIEPDLIGFTGFSMPEVDFALSVPIDGSDPADALPELSAAVVSRPGDLWEFGGGHRLLCGNARAADSYVALLGGQRAQKVATDPPFGCRIAGYVSGTHGEFVEGSDMSEAEASAFFDSFLTAMVAHLQDGAIVEMFIDARGMLPLLTAARAAGLTHLTTCVWDKGVGGLGSLYRQQAEFVLVMKHGRGRHVNNVSLGRHGRNRTTIWSAPGLNGFGRGRQEALALHPTVKPVGLICDALLDTSTRGSLIMDPFCGSGTTLLAAHRTGRIGCGIELDPVYVDVAVKRVEALTGSPAIHARSRLTFAQEAKRRARVRSSGSTTSEIE